MLRPDDQRTIAAVLLVGLVVVLVSWWLRPVGARLSLEDSAEVPLAADFIVDINRANWPEIAQLPTVGEVLARRIVARRQKRGPYRAAEELRQVEGIGPAKLKRIRPFLAPIDESRVASPP